MGNTTVTSDEVYKFSGREFERLYTYRLAVRAGYYTDLVVDEAPAVEPKRMPRPASSFARVA